MCRLIIFAALLAVTTLPEVRADILKFEAVWSSGSGSNIVSKPLKRAAFIKRGEQLTSEGLRLIDVESAIINGQRKYAGLWIGGSGTNLFDGPLTPTEFRKVIKAKRKQGLRLVDFEIIRSKAGKKLFLAVWRGGNGKEIVTRAMAQKAFWTRGEELTKKGLRLKDVEVEKVNGKVMYTGLFQSGSGTNLITAPLTRKQFTKKRDEFVAKNIELVDMERVRIGGSSRFVGVWSSGSGESRISKLRTFQKFVDFGVQQTNKGFRTEDMEILRSKSNGTPTIPTPPTNPGGPQGPDLPNLPNEISLVSGNIVTVDFTLQDGLAQLELPTEHLPEWLPLKDGEVLLPDAFCGLNLRRAGSIFWQTLGDSEVDDFPFIATPEVSDLGDDLFLGGVEFGGPIGACAGPTEEWVFPEPFLDSNAQVFEPLENMTLRIQFGSQDGEIGFKANGTPNGQILKAHQLYKPQTYNKLLELLENFDPTGPNTPYCDGVDDYFHQVCSETPGECPVDQGMPPNC